MKKCTILPCVILSILLIVSGCSKKSDGPTASTPNTNHSAPTDSTSGQVDVVDTGSIAPGVLVGRSLLHAEGVVLEMKKNFKLNYNTVVRGGSQAKFSNGELLADHDFEEKNSMICALIFPSENLETAEPGRKLVIASTRSEFLNMSDGPATVSAYFFNQKQAEPYVYSTFFGTSLLKKLRSNLAESEVREYFDLKQLQDCFGSYVSVHVPKKNFSEKEKTNFVPFTLSKASLWAKQLGLTCTSPTGSKLIFNKLNEIKEYDGSYQSSLESSISLLNSNCLANINELFGVIECQIGERPFKAYLNNLSLAPSEDATLPAQFSLPGTLELAPGSAELFDCRMDVLSGF